MFNALAKALFPGLALILAGMHGTAAASFATSPGDGASITGHWYVQDPASGMWSQMILKHDGGFHLNLTTANGKESSETQISGQWRSDGNSIVFETLQGTERYPMHYDQARLIIDFTPWNLRVAFARDAIDSYVQPLTSRGNGQGSARSAINRISK